MWAGERAERERERERERESHIGFMLSMEPNMSLDTRILGSWPEPKSRVKHSADWATQEPLHVLHLIYMTECFLELLLLILSSNFTNILIAVIKWAKLFLSQKLHLWRLNVFKKIEPYRSNKKSVMDTKYELVLSKIFICFLGNFEIEICKRAKRGYILLTLLQI